MSIQFKKSNTHRSSSFNAGSSLQLAPATCKRVWKVKKIVDAVQVLAQEVLCEETSWSGRMPQTNYIDLEFRMIWIQLACWN